MLEQWRKHSALWDFFNGLLADARAAAQLVTRLHSYDSSVIEQHRSRLISWPGLPSLKTPCFPREHAQRAADAPPRFLQRISARLHHDIEAEEPHVLAYMTLIDRVLEDRTIDHAEENVLVEAACRWNLSEAQLQAAHRHYVYRLAIAALADGVVTNSERKDLHLVTRLLGQDESLLDKVLDAAASQLVTAKQNAIKPATGEETVRGKSVCFTGEIQSTIGGSPITREIAETLASQAGLVIASNVTKKLDFLVVADPHTQSGKAKKARTYGIRILADSVFWPIIGVTTD